ncbi:alcohol dehydrogenase catalytic domain-containing protein [Micromonospora sp. DT47]|uniref:alcohol dehydrogenase catalytic domain-containing protein n=1 Tax=Micromonospora sp. DT47 TaxID=3393431 RepID=UPI003CF752E5
MLGRCRQARGAGRARAADPGRGGHHRKVRASSVCGSDLHLINDFLPAMREGDILGHEFMGEVVETGRGVQRLKAGNRVVVGSVVAPPTGPPRSGRRSWPAARAARSASSGSTAGWSTSARSTRR